MLVARGGSRLLAAVVAFGLVVVALVAVTPPAYAESPLATTKTGPEQILVGERATYTIKVANTGATAVAEYNLSLRDELRLGLTYVPGSTRPSSSGEPSVRTDGVDGHQTLVWSNVSDLPAGASTSLTFDVQASAAALPVGASFANTAQAYAHNNPREVPDFTGAGDAVGGSYTTQGSSNTTSTVLSAIEVEKSEPSAEHELLRGVHDHDTVYTLAVTNNGSAGTDAVVLTDLLPAQLEFLGCGTVDNSSAVEYAGAPRLDDSTTDLTTDCPAPTSVDTVTDPTGQPAGVYTRVRWDLGSLASGARRTVRYAAGIPQQANTALFPGGAPSAASLGQTANLDNNTGASTRETTGEQALSNRTTVAGTYQGTVATGGSRSVSDSDQVTVSAEDLAMQKSVAPAAFEAGGIATYTLDLQTGEYADAGDVVITDLLPNGLCPLSTTTNFATDDAAGDCAPEPGADPVGTGYDVVEQHADGSFDIIFDAIAAMGHSDTAQVTYQARMRPTYADSDPTVSGDDYTNTVALTGTTTSRAAVSPPDLGAQGVSDESSATLTSDEPQLVKRVQPDSADYTCSGVESDYVDSPDPGLHDVEFELGSRVCFEVRVDFSSANPTKNPVVADFLPEHLTYEVGSAQPLAGVNDVTAVFDENELTWTVGDELDGNRFVQPGGVFAYRISGIVTSLPGATQPDVTGNLAKLRWTDTVGEIGFLRDQVDFELADPPPAALTKSAVRTSGATTGALVDRDTTQPVRGGEVVDYTVTVHNDGPAETILGPDVWDVLPDGVRCADVTGIGTGGVCTDPLDSGHPTFALDASRSAVRWDQPDTTTIAAGSNLDLTYTVAFPDSIAATNSVVNEAGVASYATRNNLPDGDPRPQVFAHYPDSNVDTTVTVSQVDVAAAEDTFTAYTPNAPISKTNITAISDAVQAPGTTVSPVVVGEGVTYTIQVTVPAHTSVYDAVLTDPMPAGLTRVSSATRHSLDAGATWTAGNATGFGFDPTTGTLTFPAGYTNDSASPDLFEVIVAARLGTVAGNTHGIQRTNTATFTSNNRSGGTALTNRTAMSRVTVVEPKPVLTKTVDATGQVVAGQVLGYTLTAKDLDTSAPSARRPTLNDAVVVDCVPSELTVDPGSFVATQGTATTAAAGTNGCATGRTPVVWDVGDVAWTSGSGWPTLDYDATVSLQAAGGATYTNAAAVTGSSLDDGQNGSGDERVYSANASRSVTVSSAGFTKTTGTPTRTIGQRASYTVTTTLPADVNFFDGAVVDKLPTGLDVSSLTVDSASCTYPDASTCGVVVGNGDALSPSGRVVGWSTGDVVADSRPRAVQITYSALVADIAGNRVGTQLANEAKFGWNQTDKLAGPPPVTTTFDSSTASASANVRILEPSLTVTKLVDDGAPAPGETFTYTVTARNGAGSGVSTAYDVDVSDAVPTGVEVVGASISDGGVLSEDGRTITWLGLGPIAKSGAKLLTYQARLASPAPTSPRVNSVDVTGYRSLPSAGRRYDDVTPATATVSPALPEVLVDKTLLDSPPAYLGEETDWRLTVTSSGSSKAFGVDVADVLPQGWTYAAGSARVSIDGAPATAIEPTVTGAVAGVQTLTWTDLADLPVGDTLTVVVSTVPQSAVLSSPGVGRTVPQTNSAEVSAEDAEGKQGPSGGGSYGSTDSASTRIDAADLRVVNSHTGSPVAGQPFSWQVQVDNLGGDTAVGPFVVTDTLPAEVTGAAAGGPGWSCAGDTETLSCQRSGSLASGSSLPVITITATVPANVAAGTTLTNTASVEARTHDPEAANDLSVDNAAVTAQADLAVDKQLSGDLVAGAPATYTIAVSNLGPSVHRGALTVTDTLPAGLTYASHTGAGWSLVRDGQELAFTRSDDRSVGAVPAITVTVDVASDRRAPVSNAAVVDGTTPDPQPSNDTSTVTVTPRTSADLSLSKTHVGDFVAGEQGTYRLAVTNHGPSDAPGPLRIVDALPADLGYASVTSEDGWSCSADDQEVTCSLAGGLADGASTTLELSVDIDPDLTGAPVNTATVSSPTDDPHAPNDTDTDDAGIDVEADLGVVKTHAAATVTAGERVTYELAVTNHGPSGTPGPVELSDTLPEGMSLVSASGAGWDCSGPGAGSRTAVACTRATGLANDADAPVVEVVAAVAADAGPAISTNIASVTGPAPDLVPGNDTDEDPTTVVDEAELTLTKTTVDGGPVHAGDPAEFSLLVHNDGPSDADDVVVTDVLPAGMTVVSLSGAGWSCDEQTLACSRDTVAAGSDAPAVTVVARIGAGVAAGTTLVNEASVSTFTPGDAPAGNEDESTVEVSTSADLSVTKSHAAGLAVAGLPTTYAVDVHNHGPSDAQGPVVVRDTLPEDMSFLAATAPWDCLPGSGQVVECTLSQALSAGVDAPRLELTVQVDAAAEAGEVTNQVTVSAGTGDSVSANDSDSVDVEIQQVADLSVRKTHVGLPTVGQTFAWTLQVSNEGPSRARGVTLTDKLPAGVSFVSASGSGWTCDEADGTVTCDLTGPVGVDADAAPVEVEAKVLPAAYPRVVNTAVVDATTADLDVDDNTSSDGVDVPALANLSISQRHLGRLAVGKPGTYRITVTNDGPTRAEGPITVSDQLPDGLDAVGAVAHGWACRELLGVVTCELSGGLAAGETSRLELDVWVLAAAYPSVTNTATVTSPSSETRQADNSDSDVAQVAPLAQLDLVKEIAALDNAKMEATYRLSVTNHGPNPTVVPVRVEDRLPADLELVAMSARDWSCNVAGQRVSCVHADSMDVGDTASLRLVTRVNAGPGSRVTNVARVKGGSSAPDVDGAVVEVVRVPGPRPGVEGGGLRPGVEGGGLQPGVDDGGLQPGVEESGRQPGSLSDTGGPAWWIAMAGLLLVGTGGGLLVARRLRDRPGRAVTPTRWR